LRHSHIVWRLVVVHEVAGDVSIVTTSGRLGAAMAGQWEECLVRVAGEGKILIDLGGVDYASSVAIVTLASFLDRRESLDRREGQDRRVVACGLADALRLTFDLAGLLSRLTIAPTRAAALALLSDSR
jgi:anti-anti-sigma factor